MTSIMTHRTKKNYAEAKSTSSSSSSSAVTTVIASSIPSTTGNIRRSRPVPSIIPIGGPRTVRLFLVVILVICQSFVSVSSSSLSKAASKVITSTSARITTAATTKTTTKNYTSKRICSFCARSSFVYLAQQQVQRKVWLLPERQQQQLPSATFPVLLELRGGAASTAEIRAKNKQSKTGKKKKKHKKHSTTTAVTTKTDNSNRLLNDDVATISSKKKSDGQNNNKVNQQQQRNNLEQRKDSDDGVLDTFRSFVKTLLESLPPPLSSILQSILMALESLFGVSLLPSSSSSLPATKSIRTEKKLMKVNIPEGSKSPAPKKSSSSKVSSSAVSSTKGQTSSPQPSASQMKNEKKVVSKQSTVTAMQQHLSTDLKSTSPNYRIQRELKAFLKDPPPNLTVKVGKNLRIWIVTMKGASNTIYEGETFLLRISFPASYPTVPPSVYFLPPNIPVHEHVYTNGDICLSLLGKEWRPTMTAQSIAVSILSILSSAQSKTLPMDNALHAQNKPGAYQKDWVYHDDNC